MGMGFPRVVMNEEDASFYVDTLLKGISCVEGITERGPVNTPIRVSSAAQFERYFGGDLDYSSFPSVVKRAFAYGATLWVSRIVHGTPVTASVTLKDRAETAKNTLKISASSPGDWGNSLSVVIESTADDTGIFTLKVMRAGVLLETFTGLSMTPADENYVGRIKSDYIVVDDQFTETAGEKARPADTTGTALTGGTSGALDAEGNLIVTDADYIGAAAAHTGLYAFDEVDDALQLAVPGVTSPAVIAAGLAYCESRKDLFFIAETPFDLEPQAAYNFRMGKGDYTHATFNSSYGALYYGKPKVYDVSKGKEVYISSAADVLGVYAQSDFKKSEASVPAGGRRGRLLNCLGVDVNVAAKGRSSDGDLLTENQVNPICVFDDMGVVVWDAQTLQRQASLLRNVSVRRLMIVVEKAVAAYARAFLHEPNTPDTWRAFWRGLDPKFREWKAQDWFYDYRISCDQDAKTISDAKINTPESIQRGEFHCKIFVKPVVGIRWIVVDAIITRLDADFAELETEMTE